MKKILFSIGLLTCAWLQAQQLPHFSQYMLNDYAMNPAIGGKNSYFLGMSDNRYQWSGITDAPRTYQLTVHGPLRNPKMGVGGQLFTDITGPTRRTGFYLSYAYHLKLSEKTKLSFGVAPGILQFMVDGQKVTLHDAGDYALQNAVMSTLVPDLGVGMYCYSDRFWVGVSGMQLFHNRIKFYDWQTNSQSFLTYHFYGMLGYRQPIGDDFIFEPSALLKMAQPAPFQFDVGGRFIYKEKVWLGGAYRNLDAFDAYLGYIYRENLVLGYAYDFTTTNLRNYNSGTHELLIGIRFNQKSTGGAKPQL